MAREVTLTVMIIKRLLAALLLGAVLTHGALAQQDGPQPVVERLNRQLVEVMQAAEDQGIGYEARYERLASVLQETFNFPFMTRIAVGSFWRNLNEGQREQLVDLFTRMSIATFANRFDGYNGETFEIVEQTPGPRDAVLVRSRLVRPTGEPVGLDYLLREFEDGWQVIDVFLDSKFSELARQRSEFAAVLRSGRIEDLVVSLEQKIVQLAAP